MPTVLRVEGFRFYFFSHEPNEPPHVHVDKGECSAKFWLNEISLAKNYGFSTKDLARIKEILINNQKIIRDKWYGYFF